MTPARRRWLVFALCMTGLALALGWVSWVSLTSETRSLQMRLWVIRQESLRLALWRMDTCVSALLAGESARPFYEYSAIFVEPHAYGRDLQPLAGASAAVPSPLLDVRTTRLARFFKLHFEYDAEGELCSPQVPLLRVRELLLSERLLAQDQLEHAEALLAELGSQVSWQQLLASWEQRASEPALDPVADEALDEQRSWRQARRRFLDEYRLRRQAIATTREPPRIGERPAPSSSPPVVQESFRPYLFRSEPTGDPELLFVRPIRVGSEPVLLQGIWSDWDQLETWLLTQVAELFDGSHLDLVPEGYPEEPSELSGPLTSLPAVLTVDHLAPPQLPGWTPVRSTLVTAWLLLLVTGVAVAWVVRAALDLSERRGRFVSAVTHELRTPLTTFCMYSEMLADGVVQDEAARAHYFQTLKQESERLRRIVDNVLLYARVEGHRQAPRRESLSALELLDRLYPVLELCAAQAQRELVLEGGELPRTAMTAVDPSAVEQILVNLVDNACKYSAEAEDGRIHLAVTLGAPGYGGRLCFAVRDHGTGVPPEMAEEVFEAFRRASDLGGTRAPGIGLGLALARGMAEQMGGELVLERPVPGQGATFVLSLPVTLGG